MNITKSDVLIITTMILFSIWILHDWSKDNLANETPRKAIMDKLSRQKFFENHLNTKTSRNYFH